MKVVIASGTYPPELGGMATFVENFARRLHAQGIEVSVVAYGKEDSSVSQPFLVRTVRRGRFVFMRYLRYLLVLRKATLCMRKTWSAAAYLQRVFHCWSESSW